MSNPYENEQRDEQVAGTSEDATLAHIDGALKDLHTHTVGVIVSFDPAKQTATVQPVIQRVWIERGPVNLPVCTDCPVEFPGGGDFLLTFPVKPGDECMISFSERCIDNWFTNGQLAAPAEYRMHDLSDGIVRVGLNNQTKSISGFRMDGVDLRNRDGTTRVTLRTSGTIESVNPNGNVVLANTGQISLVNSSASFVVGTDGKVTITAPGGLVVTAPTQTNSGLIAAAGTVGGAGGLISGGTGSSGGAFNVTSAGAVTTSSTITAVGDVVGQGKSLHNHSHNVANVQSGTSTLPTTAPT